METQDNEKQANIEANYAVSKAYGKIIREVKELLGLFPTEEFRTIVECSRTDGKYELYSPLIYISTYKSHGRRCISFAKRPSIAEVGRHLDSILVRSIYKHTACEVTDVNIEDRLEEFSYDYTEFVTNLRLNKDHNNNRKTIIPQKQGV